MLGGWKGRIWAGNGKLVGRQIPNGAVFRQCVENVTQPGWKNERTQRISERFCGFFGVFCFLQCSHGDL